MIGWMINPCPAHRKKSNPKRKRGKRMKSSAWSRLVKKHGVTEAAKKYKKKSKPSRGRRKATRKGGKKMARKRKKLTLAHRKAISRGLKRGKRGKRKVARKSRRKNAWKGQSRRHSKAAKLGHRRKKSRRKNPITRKPKRRRSRSRSLTRYRSNPMIALKDILPTKGQLTEAGQIAAGAILTTASEPFIVKGIGVVYEKVKGLPMPMGFLPSIAIVPINIATAGVLGVGANVFLKDKALAGRVMAGGLAVAIVNLVRSVREYIQMGQFGVIVPEETEIGQNEYIQEYNTPYPTVGQYESDLEVEGMGIYEPETVAIGMGAYEPETVAIGQVPRPGPAYARGTIERFTPYFKG